MTTLDSAGQFWLPTRRERFTYRTAGLVLTVAFLFMAVLLKWLAFPGPGFSLTRIDVPPSVRAGDLMSYRVSYCQPAAGADVLVMRELIDHGNDLNLPGLIYTTGSAPCETRERAVGIPSYTPPGQYRLKVTTDLRVNPLRAIRQEWLSAPFHVK